MYDDAPPRKQKIRGAVTSADEGSEDTVVIEKGTWIESMELVLQTTDRGRGPVGLKFNLKPSGSIQAGSCEGDFRTLEVTPGHVFLGFQGEISSGYINRLGLLQGLPYR